MENDNRRSTYLYLDFNGKVQSNVFNERIFLRVTNLHKKHPLVQLNDYTFKGTYESTIGTNLFFEEDESAPLTSNPFEKQTPLNLKYLVKQNKVVNLKQIQFSPRKIFLQTQLEEIPLNLKHNYKTVLEKFESGALNLLDLEVPNESHSNITAVNETPENVEEKSNNTNEVNEKELEFLKSHNILLLQHQKLKELARKPVKRSSTPELVEECDNKYKNAYELNNLKCQIVQPSSKIFESPIPIQEDTLENSVDIDRCVLYGIISHKDDYPRILSNKEKNSLLSLDNFDNLSLPARYYVVQTHVNNLEEYISHLQQKDLIKKDEFGRTPQETLSIYKYLVEALKPHVLVTDEVEDSEK